MAGFYSQQGKAGLADLLAYGLRIVAVPPPLLVDWLDSSGLVLEGWFQAGSGLWHHCVVGSKAEMAAEVASHWDTDVELEALELFVLADQAEWWAPVGQVEGRALLQAQHELDRGAGWELLGIVVGTWVALSFSDPELDKEVVLEPLDLVVGSVEVGEVLLLEQWKDMAEK